MLKLLKKRILIWFIWFISLLIFLYFFIPYFYELKYGYKINNTLDAFTYSFIFIIILSIPSFVLWINYYLNNKNYKITVGKKELVIEYKNLLKRYNFSDVDSSIYVLNSYQKDVFWSGFLGYSDLAYWDLTFKNGDRYFISSLLLDLNSKPNN